MIHYSTHFVEHILTRCRQIFLHFYCLRNIYSSSSFCLLPKSLHSFFQPTNFFTMQALVPETEDEITTVTNLSKVHSLKTAIFHTMAYKLSLEINKHNITQKTLFAFLKVLYNVSQIIKKKKHLRAIFPYPPN